MRMYVDLSRVNALDLWLNDYFKIIEELSMVSSIGDIGRWAQDFMFYQFPNYVRNLVLKSEQYVSIIRSVIRLSLLN